MPDALVSHIPCKQGFVGPDFAALRFRCFGADSREQRPSRRIDIRARVAFFHIFPPAALNSLHNRRLLPFDLVSQPHSHKLPRQDNRTLHDLLFPPSNLFLCDSYWEGSGSLALQITNSDQRANCIHSDLGPSALHEDMRLDSSPPRAFLARRLRPQNSRALLRWQFLGGR